MKKIFCVTIAILLFSSFSEAGIQIKKSETIKEIDGKIIVQVETLAKDIDTNKWFVVERKSKLTRKTKKQYVDDLKLERTILNRKISDANNARELPVRNP